MFKTKKQKQREEAEAELKLHTAKDPEVGAIKMTKYLSTYPSSSSKNVYMYKTYYCHGANLWLLVLLSNL